MVSDFFPLKHVSSVTCHNRWCISLIIEVRSFFHNLGSIGGLERRRHFLTQWGCRISRPQCLYSKWNHPQCELSYLNGIAYKFPVPSRPAEHSEKESGKNDDPENEKFWEMLSFECGMPIAHMNSQRWGYATMTKISKNPCKDCRGAHEVPLLAEQWLTMENWWKRENHSSLSWVSLLCTLCSIE